MTRLALVPLTVLILAAAVVAPSATAAPAKGRVHIDYKTEGAFFIEGSFTYFRIENAAGEAVLRHRFTDKPRRLTTRLLPGRYVLVTYERPCDGNCNYLDPPTARCETRFRVRSGSRVTVKIRYDLATSTCSRTVTRR